MTSAEMTLTETNGRALALREDDGELSVAQVAAQVTKVRELMREVLREGVHYGIIPGTPKPTLYKPGAETLCMLFRLEAQYTVSREREGEHLHVDSTCILYHMPTGQRRGTGMGSCSTKEKKYGFRHDKPNKFLADQFNTVLKMSNKRALIAAVLNATAASDSFTQDLEDMPEFEQNEKPAAKVKRARIMPSEPDEPGKVYEDPPDLLSCMVEIETMMDNGCLVDARAALGSAANPAAPGSVTAAINIAHNANQISEAYRKALGVSWQRLARKLAALETKAAEPTDHDLNELAKAENEAREVFSDESGSPDEQPGAH